MQPGDGLGSRGDELSAAVGEQSQTSAEVLESHFDEVRVVQRGDRDCAGVVRVGLATRPA